MPKTKAKPTKKAPKKKAPKYSLEVTINDEVFKKKANKLEDALSSILTDEKFPFAPKTKVLVKYSKGKNERLQIWHVPKARKIFNLAKLNPISVEILANSLEADLA